MELQGPFHPLYKYMGLQGLYNPLNKWRESQAPSTLSVNMLGFRAPLILSAKVSLHVWYIDDFIDLNSVKICHYQQSC